LTAAAGESRRENRGPITWTVGAYDGVLILSADDEKQAAFIA